MITLFFLHFFSARRQVTSGVGTGTLDMGRQDFLEYVLSLMRGYNSEHGDTLPKLDVSALRHVAYVMDALIYYLRNNPDTISNHVGSSSIDGAVAIDTLVEDEGSEDIDDEDSSSLRRDDEYDDDTDQVEDEPMPLPTAPGSLHKFFVRTDSTLVLGKLFLVLCKSNAA